MPGFIEWLQTRLGSPLPGYEAQRRMSKHLYRPQPDAAPEDARESGVLILLNDVEDDTFVTLIMRAVDGGAHSGQIAFPGGKKELEDADLIATALREADEEIALDPAIVHILGPISPLYIPVSNFIVQPIIGYTTELPNLVKCDFEVADIFSISLKTLFDSKGDTVVHITVPISGKLNITAYIINESVIVWGATAMILSELESLWDEWKEVE